MLVIFFLDFRYTYYAEQYYITLNSEPSKCLVCIIEWWIAETDDLLNIVGNRKLTRFGHVNIQTGTMTKYILPESIQGQSKRKIPRKKWHSNISEWIALYMLDDGQTMTDRCQ